jgi:GLPGLI family protein
MRKLIMLFVFLIPIALMAQKNTEGEITYIESYEIDFEKQFEGNEERYERMKDMLEEFKEQRMEKVLYFNKKESLFHAVEKEEEPDFGGGNRMKMMMMRMNNPENKVYRDIQNNKVTEKQEFMGKMFLIKDEFEAKKWKFTGESEKIAGYMCQKASFKDTTTTIDVWFTTQIPVPAGPNTYGQLPGMILKVHEVGGKGKRMGERTVVATKVDLKKLDKKTIIEPAKGKEVTREEYHATVKAKMEEMRQNGGGWGRHH